MIETLVMLVLYMIVLALVASLLLYIISILPLAEPFKQWAKVFVLVICALIVIVLLLQLIGVNVPLRVRGP